MIAQHVAFVSTICAREFSSPRIACGGVWAGGWWATTVPAALPGDACVWAV